VVVILIPTQYIFVPVGMGDDCGMCTGCKQAACMLRHVTLYNASHAESTSWLAHPAPS
jgi:hypothetical protein